MDEVLVKEIFRNPDAYLHRRLEVSGWVRTIRVSKTFGFIELNDGSFFRNLQVVFDDSLPNFEQIAKLPIATALRIEGEVVESPGAKQPWELKAARIEVEGLSQPDYPLQKKKHSLEFLRTIAHLRPRSNTFSAVFRLRSVAAYAIHRFFQERDFVYVHTPIITGSDCEGAGAMFRVTTLDPAALPRDDRGEVDFTQDFFGKETNLTVSGQLEAEAFCLAFRKVYTFGPTFRAENSNTPRHAAEFWMVEPEIAFADLNDDMALAEEMLKYVLSYCLEHAPAEMEFFSRFIDPGLLPRLENVINSDFGVITYTEAIDLLKKAKQNFAYPVEWGADLQTEHERYLTEQIFRKPVFVINYPKEIKAFYMRLNDDQRTVAAMDLLVPGVGEIIGGSQREERLPVLEARMKECGLDFNDYWWYLDLRKYGGTKHAGFGLGFERAIMYMTGMANIRDVLPFPRTVNNAEF
ncbi:MAG: asparagine--tRNA ligase [Firmicutes bacterium]|nr:asparagine--tRNA ligase [Bacillota bacterium]